MAARKSAAKADTTSWSDGLRLHRVEPALGGAWIGALRDPQDSALGSILVQHDTMLDQVEPDPTYVIVRCIDPGETSLRTGGDYLVLSRFVKKL